MSAPSIEIDFGSFGACAAITLRTIFLPLIETKNEPKQITLQLHIELSKLYYKQT